MTHTPATPRAGIAAQTTPNGHVTASATPRDRPAVPAPVHATAPACHGGTGARARQTGVPVVALVGAPNSGKSTLFNALTGGRHMVGNWPGTTVEVGSAASALDGIAVELLDLPGAYSLDAQSPDEQLTRDLLLDVVIDRRPAVSVVVADAAHLARSLYLAAQLREEPQRVVVALTMTDVAERRGVTVDAAELAAGLGVDVVALDPRRREGVDLLAHSVAASLRCGPPRRREIASGTGQSDELAVADERFDWIDRVTAASAQVRDDVASTVTDRVDRWVTAPWFGPAIFLAVMWAVFELTTTVAVPVQDVLGSFFSGPVTTAATWLFAHVGLKDSWPQLFVVNGLIAGVGMLLTFVPLMIIMFALLALLEDSGYLARAAVVADRSMRAIGLPGKAFLPLVVGFGCNVPAISATRILPGAKQRIMTALLVPFTSCSARLTVYVLIAATFFPGHAGTVVFAMYLVSILIIIVVGLAMKATLWRAVGNEPHVLDLPAYQRPTLRLTAVATWLRVKGFLHTAGGIIVATVSAVWLLQAIPLRSGAAFGHVSADDSVFAAIARFIAPVFTPLGFGDWHTSSALVVGFVAKEAVVTSWAQTYAVGDPGVGQSPAQLHTQISGAFTSSAGAATIAAALAFLVFLLAYTPCAATVAAQVREIGLKWATFGIAMQLCVAWLLGFAVFQVGRHFL